MRGYRPLYVAIELLGMSLLIGLLGWRKDRRPRLAYGLALFLILCTGVMMSACGTGSSGGGGSGGNQGTPAGTYSLTVTGSFSTGTTTLTRSTNLTLVVQ
jgi:hypothetical protein